MNHEEARKLYKDILPYIEKISEIIQECDGDSLNITIRTDGSVYAAKLDSGYELIRGEYEYNYILMSKEVLSPEGIAMTIDNLKEA